MIVGYAYRKHHFCPACTLAALPTGPGEEFDGWADLSVPPMSVEANLDELAAAFGIDRAGLFSDEDIADDFPRPLTDDQYDLDDPERCWTCGDHLALTEA